MTRESGDNEIIQRRMPMTQGQLNPLAKISLVNEILGLQDERQMLWAYLETYRAENKRLSRQNERSPFKRRNRSKYIRGVRS